MMTIILHRHAAPRAERALAHGEVSCHGWAGLIGCRVAFSHRLSRLPDRKVRAAIAAEMLRRRSLSARMTGGRRRGYFRTGQ